MPRAINHPLVRCAQWTSRLAILVVVTELVLPAAQMPLGTAWVAVGRAIGQWMQSQLAAAATAIPGTLVADDETPDLFSMA